MDVVTLTHLKMDEYFEVYAQQVELVDNVEDIRSHETRPCTVEDIERGFPDFMENVLHGI